MTDTIDDLIDRLDRMLENERTALVSGDFQEIEARLEEKTALFDELATVERIEAANLTRVKEKAARNQALLDSAMEGIRMVANRMAEMRRIRENMSTYDSQGRRNRISTPGPGRLEKRA